MKKLRYPLATPDLQVVGWLLVILGVLCQIVELIPRNHVRADTKLLGTLIMILGIIVGASLVVHGRRQLATTLELDEKGMREIKEDRVVWDLPWNRFGRFDTPTGKAKSSGHKAIFDIDGHEVGLLPLSPAKIVGPESKPRAIERALVYRWIERKTGHNFPKTSPPTDKAWFAFGLYPGAFLVFLYLTYHRPISDLNLVSASLGGGGLGGLFFMVLGRSLATSPSPIETETSASTYLDALIEEDTKKRNVSPQPGHSYLILDPGLTAKRLRRSLDASRAGALGALATFLIFWLTSARIQVIRHGTGPNTFAGLVPILLGSALLFILPTYTTKLRMRGLGRSVKVGDGDAVLEAFDDEEQHLEPIPVWMRPFVPKHFSVYQGPTGLVAIDRRLLLEIPKTNQKNLCE